MTKATDEKTSSAKLAKASARYLHLSPRKMRLVTNLIKNMPASDAIVQLAHTNKKGAPMVLKLVKSAVANASNNFSLQADHLYIKSITTDMGVTMKRYFPRARGSAFPIQRKTCHVNVVLEERKSAKASKSRIAGLFKKKESDKVESVDQKDANAIKSSSAKASEDLRPVKEEGKKSQIFRTDEQRKMSTVANKRRLFNRKSGE